MKMTSLTLLVLMIFVAKANAAIDIQHWQSKQGALVYFAAAPELPMVDVRVSFDAGSARDDGLPGLSKAVHGLLYEGAGGISATDISSRFADVGAQLGGGSLRDMAWLSLRTLADADWRDPAMNALNLMLVKPDFTQAAFEREIRLMQAGVLNSKQNPGSVASTLFYQKMYGDHPYAHPVSGTEDSLPKITLPQIKQFYKTYYVAKNAVVAIVGGISRKQAMQLAEDLLEGMPTGSKPLATAQPKDAPGGIHKEPFDSTQTHILIGHPAIQRGHPDYHALYLANYVLGGNGLVSRLSQKVREENGLAYSVYSYFSPMAAAGPFVMGAQTRNDKAAESYALMLQELKRYMKDGPSDEELEASKKSITGGFPLRVATNSNIVEYLSVIGFYGLPNDYLTQFNDKIQSVTRKDILDALRRNVRPESLWTIMVGGVQATND